MADGRKEGAKRGTRDWFARVMTYDFMDNVENFDFGWCYVEELNFKVQCGGK